MINKRTIAISKKSKNTLAYKIFKILFLNIWKAFDVKKNKIKLFIKKNLNLKIGTYMEY